MDIKTLFEPYRIPHTNVPFSNKQFGFHIQKHIAEFPQWKEADILILGCSSQNTNPIPSEPFEEADAVREKLYRLSIPEECMNVADLGNLKPQSSSLAYAEALTAILQLLLLEKKTIILIGGTQQTAYAQYLAYEPLNKDVEMVHIDAKFDLENADNEFNPDTVSHKIFSHRPCYLFNYTNLGYQSYFVAEQDRRILRDLHFFALRYGELHNQIEEAEPFIRAANFVSFDLGAIRHSDCPGTNTRSPGGFSVMEACRMARYAGLANKVSSISFCEMNLDFDINQQTPSLTSLMIWYFIHGYYGRRDISPESDRDRMVTYEVQINAGVEQLVFYQDPISNKWWMAVPYQEEGKIDTTQVFMLPCAESDYLIALEDEIPDKWWQTYYKLI